MCPALCIKFCDAFRRDSARRQTCIYTSLMGRLLQRRISSIAVLCLPHTSSAPTACALPWLRSPGYISASPARTGSHRARADSDGYLSRDKVVEAIVRQNDIVGLFVMRCVM